MTNSGSTGAALRIIAVCLVGIVTSQLAHGAPGDLDPTFGRGGVVRTSLGGVTIDLATALVRQPDGKLVAAGTSNAVGDEDFAVLRFEPDGDLDPTFGSGGVAIFTVGSARDAAFAMVLQPDGKIVVAGT